ncbi:MAG TPA: acetylglutamate kinase [Polyangia bacterium]
MTGHFDRDQSMAALKRALPYIRLYRDRIFVVKIGGAIGGDRAAVREVIEQVSVLRELGVKVILVHGGGPQTTALGERLGLAATVVEGRRVTDPETLEVAVMTINGTVNTAILAVCRAANLPAVGLSGVDAGLVRATRRPPQVRDVNGEQVRVDYGLVGDIVAVDAAVLTRLLDAGLVPVVSPLSCDADGQVLNINADTVAATIAGETGAEKLILVTDTPGLLEDRQNPRSLISYTDVRGLGLLKERGAVEGGMLPKVEAALAAIARGVKRVHMVGYRRSSLLVEVFTNEGAGTLIVKDAAELPAAEHGGGEPAHD